MLPGGQTKTMRAVRGPLIPFILLLLALGGCTSAPGGRINLEKSAYQSPEWRADHPPWGTLSVRFVRDIRPGWELGKHSPLHESYYSDELFELPVPVTLKRLILKELQETGVFRPEKNREHSHYVAEFTLRHFFLKADRTLLDLIPILPTTSFEAVIDFEVRLTDQDGRVFLDKRYDSRSEPWLSRSNEGSGSGADQLLFLLSTMMADLVEDMDRGVQEFWRDLGLPVPVQEPN